MSINMVIAIMSFNRGRYLANAVKSIQDNMPGIPIIIYDGNSQRPETLEVLRDMENQGIPVRIDTEEQPEGNYLGGLYRDMNRALEEAISNGYEYLFFFQDDIQVVRAVDDHFYDSVTHIFNSNENVMQVLPVFSRAIIPNIEETTFIDEQANCYLQKNYGVCDVGILDIKKVKLHNFRFMETETAHSIYTHETLGLVMAFSRYPIINYLPWPETVRETLWPQKRSLLASFFIHLNSWGMKQGLHPHPYMSATKTEELLNRPIEELPIAEYFLTTTQKLRKPWSLSSVFGLQKLKDPWHIIRLDWIFNGSMDYMKNCKELTHLNRTSYKRRLSSYK